MAAPRKKTAAKKPFPSTRSPVSRGTPARSEPKAGSGKSKAAASASKGGRAKRNAGPVNPDSMPDDVVELITAIDEYKRKNARPFPSWSEILEIVKELGYRKSA